MARAASPAAPPAACVRGAAERYLEVVRGQGTRSYFDAVVLAARDERQKALWEGFVRQRVGLRQIPPSTEVLVVADPAPTAAHRAGSGGAVLNCLRVLGAHRLSFASRRVLLVLSGGPSERSPHLAAVGEAFAPVPFDLPLGCPAPTVADLKLVLLAPYGDKGSPAGIYVAAGDVYDVMDGRSCPVSPTGITGFAHLDTCEYGNSHGVFEVLPGNSHLKAVVNYRQKEAVHVLRDVAAGVDGRVLADGDFFMGSDVCEALYHATASCTLPLPGGEFCCWTTFFDACTPSAPRRGQREDLEPIYLALEKLDLFALDVSSDPSHSFSHVGTLPEYLALFTAAGVSLLGSVLTGGTTCPASSLVERSSLCGCTVGEGAVVSGVVASGMDFPAGTVTVGLHFGGRGAEEYALFQYPLEGDTGALLHAKPAIGHPTTLARALRLTSVHPTLASFSAALDTKRAILGASHQLTRRLLIPELGSELRDAVRSAEVHLPVRLILAGGWSDTPPMCLVHGGAVFNIAVKLNGELPIRVRAESSDAWYFESDGEPSRALEVGDNDPCALIKACLGVLGPPFTVRPVRVVTRSSVPNGSGLGASSILMLGVLRAVLRVHGLSLPLDEESDLVLAAEQALGSGGGWQDQVGGGAPGAKLAAGNAGGNLEVVPVALPPGTRFLCLNSRIRRRAKVVLDRVVEGYREGRNVRVFSAALPENARRMAEAFARGDLEAAGRELGEYRSLCGTLAPNFLPPELAPVMAHCAGFCHGGGVNLMGAGAGGFIVGLLRGGFDLAGARKIANEHGVDVEVTELSVYE